MGVLITGGAGFIGSHLVEALVRKGYSVKVLDNLSSGSRTNLFNLISTCQVAFLKGDCRNREDVEQALKGVNTVFHLSANPEVRLDIISPETCYKQNVEATHIILEKVKESKIESFVYTSSSTVYGDAQAIPTPEDYSPLLPISVYGASKLASEALISAYASTYGFKAIIYRLANVVGPRSQHGVIHDFILKLKKNPEHLEILGDGNQTKSYLHIADCIEAMLLGIRKSSDQIEIFNVGAEDQISVKTIAMITVEEMGLENVELVFTGGVNGGRGWKGDVKNMLLDIGKLKSLGWKPKLNTEQAVRKAINHLITEL